MGLHFDSDDHAGATAAIDRLVDDYEAASGADGWVGHQLLHHKLTYLDGRLDHWTVDDLGHILLEVFPAKVVVEEGDIDGVAPDARAFLRWLHDAHGLTGDPLPRLLAGLDRMAPHVAAALRDPSRFGPAKSLVSQAGLAGVDLTDGDALQDFVAHLNALPFEQRRAMLPLAGDDPAGDRGWLPPPVPMPEDRLRALAVEVPLLRWTAALLELVGEGRPITQTGRLRLADARALTEALDTRDAFDPEFAPDFVHTTRSAEELADLDLVWRLATQVGFVATTKTRVRPGPAADLVGSDPVEAVAAMLDALLDLGILAHRYRRQQYMVPPWIDMVDASVPDLLIALYATEEPLPVEALVDAARSDLVVAGYLRPPTGETDPVAAGWWDVPEHNLRQIVRRLADLGVAAVEGVERQMRVIGGREVGEYEVGGEVLLTLLGRHLIAEIGLALGYEVPDVGGLADLDATALLTATAGEDDGRVAVAEVAAWGLAREPGEAIGAVVAALADRQPDLPLAGGGVVLVTIAEQVGVETAEPHLMRLAQDPLVGPLAMGWLMQQGRDVPPVHGNPVMGLVAMAALGAPADAVVTLTEMGPVAVQRQAVDEARAGHGRAAVPLLEGVADLHPDKSVAKAARKALFRLGERRGSARR